MAKKYDVVAALGEYTDREGKTKVRWGNCGAVFQTEKGFSLKLDMIPVEGEGWFKLFEPKSKAAPPPKDDFDDNIPF